MWDSLGAVNPNSPSLEETKLGLRARIIKNAEKPVGDIMLKIRGTISADADVLEALMVLGRKQSKCVACVRRRSAGRDCPRFRPVPEDSGHLAEDDHIDLKKHKLHRDFEERLKEEPASRHALTHLFLVSRHLERIVDHATNIAEDVIYMVTGEIVRRGKT